MLYSDQPGFSLVSNGAEIILIDKKFYLENCPQRLLARLRREVRLLYFLFPQASASTFASESTLKLGTWNDGDVDGKMRIESNLGPMHSERSI